MTIPAAGTNIQKSDIINEFTSDVINVANAAVVYTLSNNPFTNAGYGAYANPYLSNTVAAAPTSGELSADIDASGVATAIADLLRTYAYNASRIRDVLYRYDQTGNPYALPPFVTWGQNITLMNDSYRQPSLLTAGVGVLPTTPPAAGTAIEGGATSGPSPTDGALDEFINRLASVLTTVRANTITLTACHSSCHVSCHGARGRR
ncbi:hypothetical protein E4H12_13025 [Candidatus Thorarchaeota archaeon]|nr:MAG: hypothetical protein E4H12_13025 [Candidatus Thorarchaeota archaeon]